MDGTALRALSAGPLARRPLALTGERPRRFDLVALTWTGALPGGTTLHVRVREGGRWTGWNDLEAAEHGPDTVTRAPRRRAPASEPLLTAGADGVQVRVDGAAPPPVCGP